MKKIKLILATILLLFSLSFVSNVYAAETTESVTTEETTVEVTEEEFELTLPEINEETINEAKTWVVGVLMSLLAVMTSSLVVGIIVNKMKIIAISKVDEALKRGTISQEKADAATIAISDAASKVESKLNEFSDNIESKIEAFGSKVEGLDEKIAKLNEFFSGLIDEVEAYIDDEEEV